MKKNEETISVVNSGESVRDGLFRGIKKLYDAVSTTLGPSGKTVIISNGAGTPPHITKDGVTVAKNVSSEHPIEQVGIDVIKEVSEKTAKFGGDGTTTATVIAYNLISGGLELIERGVSPIVIAEKFEALKEYSIELLNDMSIDIKNNFNKSVQVATVSANNNHEIGYLVASTIDEVSVNGAVTVAPSNGYDTYVTVNSGYHFNSGYISPHFARNESVVTLENALVFICKGRLSSVSEITPVLEICAEERRPLFVIADSYDPQVIGLMILNGSVQVVAVEAPTFDEEKKAIIEDISIITDASVYEPSMDSAYKLGEALKVKVSQDETILFGINETKPNIAAHIEFLKKSVTPDTPKRDVRFTNNRIARLAGGVATIHVGGATVQEMKELQDRVEDAVFATKAALTGGVLPGGGVALHNVSTSLFEFEKDMGDEVFGVFRKSIEEPMFVNVENSKYELTVNDIEKISKKSGFGMNSKTGEFVNMVEDGIVDPTDIVILALKNAVSVANTFLNTSVVLTKK